MNLPQQVFASYSMKSYVPACLIAAIALHSAAYAQTTSLDPALKPYVRIDEGFSEPIRSQGSDTLNNLMSFWVEDFKRFYPGIKPEVEGKGSSTAPTALIAGTAQFGPMSRKMKGEEVDAFEKVYYYKPTQVGVAIDALAVYVHKDNPIEKLTIAQLDAIYSSTRKNGGPVINTWGDLGLTGDWAKRPISIYGRNSASGTYGFFKEIVLKNGDYKSEVKEQVGSASVVQGVEKELGGIGYSGIGYRTSGVRTVPIVGKDGMVFEPTQENAVAFKYPISRYLYIYINVDPQKGPVPLVREFIRFVLSRDGQDDVSKDGYFPLPATHAARFLKASKCE
jgi:phosphate transport system substrate-binding protein